MQKTITQIVEETVEYYRTNSRGVSPSGSCMYWGHNRSDEEVMCAVGRCMTSPQGFIEDESLYHGGIIGVDQHICNIINNPEGIDSQLKPEYRGHPIRFWAALQRIHDLPENFEMENGEQVLSHQGKQNVEELLEIYGN